MGLKRRMHVKPEFSLAAMIDVIFLLLMFFMLTSNFVTTNSLQLQLPSSSSSAPVASTSLSVSIRKPGQYYLGTKPIAKQSLEASLLGQVKAEKKDPKEVTVTSLGSFFSAFTCPSRDASKLCLAIGFVPR